MEMWLTKGMFGEKIELIAEGLANAKAVMERLFMWKSDLYNRKLYKIESYDRLISGDNCVAVDFGDYSKFMLVVGEGAENVIGDIA